MRRETLNSATAGDELEQQDNDCDDEQEVDETSADVKRETTKPHQYENDDDDPEKVAHECNVSFRGLCSAIVVPKWVEPMQKAECRMQKTVKFKTSGSTSGRFCLFSAFCILHSAFCIEKRLAAFWQTSCASDVRDNPA